MYQTAHVASAVGLLATTGLSAAAEVGGSKPWGALAGRVGVATAGGRLDLSSSTGDKDGGMAALQDQQQQRGGASGLTAAGELSQFVTLSGGGV